jgi:GDP-L-fucose synthase
MKQDSKIFIAGHRGLVGSALVRNLKSRGYTNIVTVDKKDVDLRNQSAVDNWFVEHKPEYVFLAAAKVGGIGFNKQFPADFVRDNLSIQTNVIDAAYRNSCKKLLFMGSACIYP